jgi:methylthioribose-1-phosphate isomerase
VHDFSKEQIADLLSLSKVPKPLVWRGDCLDILDQRLLPHEISYISAKTWQDCHDAIKSMATRGAPVIGICGAYGMALAHQCGENLAEVTVKMKSARPTAVNLMWAVDRIVASDDPVSTALELELDDHRRSFSIAKNGSLLVKDGMTILTHCNSGGLAAGGFGTALGIITWAKLVDGKNIHVINTETRPYLQGARLTSFELGLNGIDDTLIPDLAVASVMKNVDLVVVGADRIAKNGDVANKIGTLTIAITAKHFDVPFYVAAPKSSFDPETPGGSSIKIEERPVSELTEFAGKLIAPANQKVFNPGFDVTPHELITGFVTEE